MHFFPFNLISVLNAHRYQKSVKQNIARGLSRISTAEIEFFMIIVYSFKPLTVFIENSVLDVWGVLYLPLIVSRLLITLNKLIFCRLLKHKIIPLENGCKVETNRENLSLYQKSPFSSFPLFTLYIIVLYIIVYNCNYI